MKMNTANQMHNGWTNWDTWECFNLLSSYEDIFNKATRASNHDIETASEELACLVVEALGRTGADLNHIDFKPVNFQELINDLQE